MMKMKSKKDFKINQSKGFSLVEVMVILVIMSIGAAITVSYLSGFRKLYKPDEESARVGDLMQEARQRSLTQRETMRVEINLDKGTARLIDENGDLASDGNGDDVELKQTTLFATSEVVFSKRPDDISVDPPEPIQVLPFNFYQSDYPGSELDKVVTLRFKRNGSVTDKNDVPLSGSLYVWSPRKSDPDKSEIARAITVLGGSGIVRFYEWNTSSANSNKWKDSRR
jgi:prepilin-type N-terminal cleavage/methylation domain-containing protein